MSNLLEETKHKFSAQCMNCCIEWKLFASIVCNKNSIGYSFNGKSLFFKQLDASILNVLQNSFLTNQDKTTKNVIKTYAEQSHAQLNEQNNPGGDDILNVKFPIDNSEFVFMIIDSNLGIAENLKNLFFLEFDLSNCTNNKDQIKLLKDINNECVEREILFNLNGTLHGTQLFKSDLKFSVEYRKFIKSMQFRLEKYKHEKIEKKKCFKKYHTNGNVGIKNTFYTKILSNINLGIEFYKPSHSDVCVENFNFPTNFNSIVNSNISITKLYLEVCIPKIFINSGFRLSIAANNKKSNDSSKEITAIDSFQMQNDIHLISAKEKKSEKDAITSLPQKIHTPNVVHQPIIIERSNSTHFDNDFNRMKNKKPSSKQLSPNHTLRNNLGINLKVPPHTCFSPEFNTKVPPPLNFSKMNFSAQDQNNPCVVFGKKLPFTSLSPTSMSFHPNNNGQNAKTFLRTPIQPKEKNDNIEGCYLNPRRFSENTFDKFHDNPLSQLSGMKLNSGNNSTTMSRTMSIIGSPPMYLKLNPETMYNFNMTNSFKKNIFDYLEEPHQANSLSNGYGSPRSMASFQFNGGLGFPVVPTIQKKMEEWEDLNEMQERNNIMVGKASEQASQNINAMNLKYFTSYYEGLCNFLIFLRSCTAYINKKHTSLLKSTTLRDFFRCFTRTSIFGLEVSYLYDNWLINTTYSCTLSSMEIVIKDTETTALIIDKLIQLNKCNPEIKTSLLSSSEEGKIFNRIGYPVSNCNEYSIFDSTQKLNFKVVILNSTTISIEFYETKPPHLRPILINQLEQFFKGFEVLKEINLMKIDSSSWFSLLWTPYKSTKGIFMNTSFLTYYQLYNSNYISNESSSSSFTEIPIIGILPIKFENKLFLQKINAKNQSGIGYKAVSPGMGCYPQTCYFNENNHNNLVFKSSIDNVHNIVIKNCRKTSIDYEFYLKSNLSSIVN